MKQSIFVLLLISLLISSCNNDETKHDNLHNRMESYIYDNEDDAYGFKELCRISEKTTKLSIDKDIYLLQEHLKNAVNLRMQIVAHTYFLPKAGISNDTQVLLETANKVANDTLPSIVPKYNGSKLDMTILEINGKDLKTCPNPTYKSMYLTQDEIDDENYRFYNSIPEELKMIKELESRKFDGYRHFYACKYRKKTSDSFIIKSFVVYENNNNFEICELKYDYDLFRSYIRAISNVDLKDSYVVSVHNKHDGRKSYDLFRNMIHRLGIDITDFSAIRGY